MKLFSNNIRFRDDYGAILNEQYLLMVHPEKDHVLGSVHNVM